MAEKTIKTRIRQRFATIDEWKTVWENFKPLKGEICKFKIPANKEVSNYGLVNSSEDRIFTKTGDGEHLLVHLPWDSATVSDNSHNHTLGNVSGLVDELNKKVENLADLGVAATATELNYMQGVLDNIQKQLDELKICYIEEWSPALFPSTLLSSGAQVEFNSDAVGQKPPAHLCVTFDGYMYRCAEWGYRYALDTKGYYYYGDSRLDETYSDYNPSSTPFLIFVENVNTEDVPIWKFCITFTDGGSHSVGIAKVFYNTIHENFIPDTFATKTYVDTAVNNAIGAAMAAEY